MHIGPVLQDSVTSWKYLPGLGWQKPKYTREPDLLPGDLASGEVEGVRGGESTAVKAFALHVRDLSLISLVPHRQGLLCVLPEVIYRH